MPKNSIKGAANAVKREDAKLRRAVMDAKTPGKKLSPAFQRVTMDSFQNFAAQLGIGTGNLTSFNTYGFNPITRIHTLLEWIHRGSWIGGVAVDIVADDMTRAGISLKGNIKPESIEKINAEATRLGIWSAINDTAKWARLFGGCIGVLLIDGQDPSTEFRIKTVSKEQFKGILPLDRWMVEPDLTNLVSQFGPQLGMPPRYRVTSDTAPVFRGKWIHYTRCIRMEGIRLPYWQRVIENLWGLSVLERLYDRMTAFDAASTGAAQLLHKLHLRTYKIEDLRSNINQGGDSMTGLLKYVDMMRKFQSIEGMTLMDKDDEFEVQGSTAVGGVAELMTHFGQQISGALQIPLVRLFGQSPIGLNATGESDLRMYYDGIYQQQERYLHEPIATVYRCIAQSLGIKLPDDFDIRFNPLWQLMEKEKAEIAQVVTTAVTTAQEAGLITQRTGLQELRQSSETTGVFSNITDDDIAAAEIELPPGLPVEEETAAIRAGGGSAEDAEFQDPLVEGKTAREWSNEMTRLRDIKPRPIEKLYGTNGPTTEQLEKWKSDMREWNKLYGRVSRNQKVALQLSNEAFRKWKERGGTYDAAHTSAGQLAWHHDLQVVIENPAGTERRGYGWVAKMPADYGYVRRVDGADGDALDCYIGPAPESSNVFVINQRRLQDGAFDEHKIMLGYHSQESAIEDYVLGYTDGSGPRRMMDCIATSMDEFKEWMKDGDHTKPYARS